MSVVKFEPKTPKATTELVQYLRKIADHIEAGETETDPRSALLVLTGPVQHEVLHVGHDAEPGFLTGALEAARAVYNANYNTHGGNIRPRTHQYSGGAERGDLTPIRTNHT